MNTLINSYELLEERLNQTDDKIEKLEVELKGDKNQEKKGKKEMEICSDQGLNFISHE